MDEFCAVCGYVRNYAIGLLNRPVRRRRRTPGPQPKHDAAVLEPFKPIWLSREQHAVIMPTPGQDRDHHDR